MCINTPSTHYPCLDKFYEHVILKLVSKFFIQHFANYCLKNYINYCQKTVCMISTCILLFLFLAFFQMSISQQLFSCFQAPVMANSSNVCVIGGGVSGILAVKYCLEYGLSVQCYEVRPSIGGIWTGADPSQTQRDSSGQEMTSVHDKICLNTSQFVTTFSDFPLPEDLIDASRFLKARNFFLYLERFANHYGVKKHVMFSAKVTRVTHASKSSDKRWAVTVQHEHEGGTSEITTHHDHIIVASGLYSTPFVPAVSTKLKV